MNEQRNIWQNQRSAQPLSGLRTARRRDANCRSEGKNDTACRDYVLRRDSRKRMHRSDIWRSRSPLSDRSKTHFRHCPPLLTRSITVTFANGRRKLPSFFEKLICRAKPARELTPALLNRLHFLGSSEKSRARRAE